jgi:hypothetical protein
VDQLLGYRLGGHGARGSSEIARVGDGALTLTRWILLSAASALLAVAATDYIPRLWDHGAVDFRLPLAALGKAR